MDRKNLLDELDLHTEPLEFEAKVDGNYVWRTAFLKLNGDYVVVDGRHKTITSALGAFQDARFY